MLPHLTASIGAYSQHPFHPSPSEGRDAQVRAGDKQGVAIHVTGAQAAPGLGISCFLHACSVRKNSLLAALVVPGQHFLLYREVSV